MEKKTSKTPKFNLYKKEQLVLTIILLCFVLSGNSSLYASQIIEFSKSEITGSRRSKV